MQAFNLIFAEMSFGQVVCSDDLLIEPQTPQHATPVMQRKTHASD